MRVLRIFKCVIFTLVNFGKSVLQLVYFTGELGSVLALFGVMRQLLGRVGGTLSLAHQRKDFFFFLLSFSLKRKSLRFCFCFLNLYR